MPATRSLFTIGSSRLVTLLALVAAMLLVFVAQTRAEAERLPNIVFIMADDK